LEESKVSGVTALDYRRRLAMFMQWCFLGSLKTDSIPELQRAVLLYLEVLYFDGELIHEALRLMASLVFLRDDVTRGCGNLPRTSVALAGWRRLAPARSRLPVPWPVACLLASWMMTRGLVCHARRTILAFITYVRPSEALRIRVVDVVPPLACLTGACARRWSLVLNPFERGSASKTGEFDESLIFDNPEFGFFDRILAAATHGRSPTALLFEGTYVEWAAAFTGAGMALGLGTLGPPVLYQLRHGGASHELLSGARDINGIKKRGRWLSDTSLRRYEKGGRVAQQMARLPTSLQQACALAAERIGGILDGSVTPVVP
jgi:hypothetical protein